MRYGSRPRVFAQLAAALVAGALACTGEPEPPTERQPPHDLAGHAVDPFAGDPHVTVLFFVATRCPISKRYAPTMQHVQHAWAPRGVRSFLVYPGPRETPKGVRKHLEEHGFTMPALLDADQVLVGRAQAHRTPEVAVFRANGTLAYEGRIDDRYVSFGQARPEPSRRDLELALDAVLEGRDVTPMRTEAVGCEITRPAGQHEHH